LTGCDGYENTLALLAD